MLSISTIEALIRNYGYWALLIGTFLEGETILIIGGLAAHLGFLELPYVMLIAFAGSFSGDQLYYYVGYFKGRELLSRHLNWQIRAKKIQDYIERYRDLIILGFRFAYGMRIMTPFVIGTCRNIGKIRFTLLNAAGAATWSVAVSLGGYFFGYALEVFIKDVKSYELYAMAVILIIGVILWLVHRYRESRREN